MTGRKLVPALVILTFILNVFTACGTPDKNPDGVIGTGDEGGSLLDDVQIRINEYSQSSLYMFYPEGTPLYDAAKKHIAGIEEEYGCKIKLNIFPSAESVSDTTSALASGADFCDIVSLTYLNEQDTLTQTGAFYPLTEVKDTLDYENQAKFGYPGVLEVMMKDGIPYAVTPFLHPLRATGNGFPVSVYNRALLIENGNDIYESYEKGTWNWDAFRAFLTENTVENGDGEKVYACGFDLWTFIEAALYSNGFDYVKNTDGILSSDVDSPKTLEALTWVKETLSDYNSCINSQLTFDTAVEALADGDIRYTILQLCDITEKLTFRMPGFGIIPFPCGPSGEYGVQRSDSAMYSYSIYSLAEDPETAAAALDRIFEPFAEYPDEASLLSYAEQTYFYPEDIELVMNINRNSRSAYYPVGGYNFVMKAASQIKSKAPSEIIDALAPAYDKLITRYIIPNYSYISTHPITK